MKKRILSLVLATLLIAAMALPASATSISDGRTWNGVLYQTNDTCNPTNFHCVIECTDMEHTVKTDVEGFIYTENGDVRPYYYLTGESSALISVNLGSFQRAVSYMYAYHYVDETYASQQKVWAA